jgi:hypothetical protein
MIVENTTKPEEEKLQQLPSLFKKLVEQYDNHTIEKVTFLEQFDKILSLIKE